MKFTAATLLSALATIASAYTPANTAQSPSGNPIIHPGLGELITAGTPYTITWTPTTQGSISLLLLRGPSTNVVPILTIADTVPNTGSYVWNPPTTLQHDTTGYGIELIVEPTGQYQYSPQCGVSNPSFSSSSNSGAAGSRNGTAAAGAGAVTTTVPVAYVSSSATSYANATWTGNFSVPVLTPTVSMSVPATLMSTFVAQTSVAPVVTRASAAAASPTAKGAARRIELSVGGLIVAGVVGALMA